MSNPSQSRIVSTDVLCFLVCLTQSVNLRIYMRVDPGVHGSNKKILHYLQNSWDLNSVSPQENYRCIALPRWRRIRGRNYSFTFIFPLALLLFSFCNSFSKVLKIQLLSIWKVFSLSFPLGNSVVLFSMVSKLTWLFLFNRNKVKFYITHPAQESLNLPWWLHKWLAWLNTGMISGCYKGSQKSQAD